MTSLIHLNGPPGIGKSTLSALYVDRHPGALNLDIDSFHRLVGGWQDEDNRTHDLLRPVALAMASSHLRGGHDVILPQYLADVQEIEAFEIAAHEQGADFRRDHSPGREGPSPSPDSTAARTTASGVSTTDG